MKRTVKANDIGLILAVIGIAVSVIFGAVVFPNWDSHAEIELTFAKNSSEKISSYYDVNCDALQVYQSAGNSKCMYTIYHQSRGASRYTLVTSGLTFSENDTWNGITYSLKACWWNDVRFKVSKTAGTSVKSTMVLSLGETTD